MPNSVVDLRLLYKKETGEYPPTISKPDGANVERWLWNWKIDMEKYVEWLEQVAITHLK